MYTVDIIWQQAKQHLTVSTEILGKIGIFKFITLLRTFLHMSPTTLTLLYMSTKIICSTLQTN